MKTIIVSVRFRMTHRFESGSLVVVDDAEVTLVAGSNILCGVLQNDIRDLKDLNTIQVSKTTFEKNHFNG